MKSLNSILLLLIFTVLSSKLFATDRIASDPSEANPIEVGKRIPDVNLRDAQRGPINLNLQIDNKPTVLIFYRGGWCPVCNKHKAELTELYKEFALSGYQLIIISPDPPEMITEMELSEDTLAAPQVFSDFQLEAARAFGVAFRAEDEYIDKAAQYDKRILERSKELRNVLPLTSVFIIDSNGIVQYVHVSPNTNELMTPELILNVAQDALE
jgi:peroxiredoxin